MNTQLRILAVIAIGIGLLLSIYAEVDACTRIFWNTNPDLLIVGRNEDYVTASHPTFVATPRGVKRWGSADESKRSKSISWTVKYGNVASYANNRFPNDGMNEAGLNARTLFYVDGDPNETIAPALCDNYKCTATTITNAQKPVKLASSPSVKKVV
jgi:choloylglycine hydrolase